MQPTITTQSGPVANLTDVINGVETSLEGFDISASDDATPVSCGISAAVSNLGNAADSVHDTTYIAVAAVLRSFGKFASDKFDDLVAMFSNNVLVETVQDDTGVNITAEQLIKSGGSSAMLKNNKPTDELKLEVSDWFKSLVPSDVRSVLNLNTDPFASVLASAPAKIDKRQLEVGGKPAFLERKLVDLGVVRMPGVDNPDFLLFSLKIRVWTDCDKASQLVYDEKSCLSGECHWRKFEPRVSMIESLSNVTRNKAEAEGKRFYGGI